MRKMFCVLAYAAALLSLSPAKTEAQIQIMPLPGQPTDAENLAKALIGSPGVTLVSGSASFTGFNDGSGFFTGGEDFLPFNEGIFLTSGRVSQLPGPNTGSESSNPDLFDDQIEKGAITPGDQQLSQLVGAPTFNAAVLEFSFIPSHDVVSFRYVFGSEEYNEFVGSEFNDIFAFFLNGSNIALIPGSQVEIQINSVNAKSNSQFFTDNTLPAASLNTKLDGLVGVSRALFATGPVIAGRVNTMRLAVADVADARFDSAVAIERGSFIDAPPPAVCGNGSVEPGEGCDDANTLPGDGCSPTCAIEQGVCGDGTVDPLEQCDPPDGVTCDKQCQTIPIACGNGIVQPGEQCEPPNTNTCDASCHTVEFPVEFPVEFCGDEILESNEECDDGNTVSGDGCSSDCRIEGSACSDFPCGRRGSKVELCHVPPGNERQKHTLCIAPSAVPAHLTHHPVYCGPCDFHHSRRGEDDSRRGKKKDDARKGRGR